MATIEGARALGLGEITGSIEPGKQADLVLVETDSPNMFPVYDPYSALVYSAIASNVRDVYVAGECLVKEKLVREDFAKIRNDLREKMERTAFKDIEESGVKYRKTADFMVNVKAVVFITMKSLFRVF